MEGGFALDISLIPGHGSLFVSRGKNSAYTGVGELEGVGWKRTDESRSYSERETRGRKRGGKIQKKMYTYMYTNNGLTVYEQRCTHTNTRTHIYIV